MLTSDTSSAEEHIGDGLIMRTVADAGDVERVACFNGQIHGDTVTGMTRNLFLHHPDTRPRDLVFVEDEVTREVVSSLCLIPWTWRYGDALLRTGELGIVGTRENYRGRGLVRAQTDYHRRRLSERGCVLSQIQGIPYFYRQFGYQYALPLEGGLRLEFRDIPAVSGCGYEFRRALIEDIPVLMGLYRDAVRDLTIYPVRSEMIWRYRLVYSEGTEMSGQYVLILIDGGIVGYVWVPDNHFDDELAVGEVSRLSFDAALALLNHLRVLALERKAPGIRLNLPANCTLMQLANTLGARDLGTYAWQICIPDRAAFLRALTPVFERRIAESPFSGLTQDVRVGLYREVIVLRFVDGHLTRVDTEAVTGSEGINLPPQSFAPLVLGYKTIADLHEMYPDLRVAPLQRLLADTIFPRERGFVSYSIY